VSLVPNSIASEDCLGFATTCFFTYQCILMLFTLGTTQAVVKSKIIQWGVLCNYLSMITCIET
jgi:hypothetical protein